MEGDDDQNKGDNEAINVLLNREIEKGDIDKDRRGSDHQLLFSEEMLVPSAVRVPGRVNSDNDKDNNNDKNSNTRTSDATDAAVFVPSISSAFSSPSRPRPDPPLNHPIEDGKGKMKEDHGTEEDIFQDESHEEDSNRKKKKKKNLSGNRNQEQQQRQRQRQQLGSSSLRLPFWGGRSYAFEGKGDELLQRLQEKEKEDIAGTVASADASPPLPEPSFPYITSLPLAVQPFTSSSSTSSSSWMSPRTTQPQFEEDYGMDGNDGNMVYDRSIGGTSRGTRKQRTRNFSDVHDFYDYDNNYYNHRRFLMMLCCCICCTVIVISIIVTGSVVAMKSRSKSYSPSSPYYDASTHPPQQQQQQQQQQKEDELLTTIAPTSNPIVVDQFRDGMVPTNPTLVPSSRPSATATATPTTTTTNAPSLTDDAGGNNDEVEVNQRDENNDNDNNNDHNNEIPSPLPSWYPSSSSSSPSPTMVDDLDDVKENGAVPTTSPTESPTTTTTTTDVPSTMTTTMTVSGYMSSAPTDLTVTSVPSAMPTAIHLPVTTTDPVPTTASPTIPTEVPTAIPTTVPTAIPTPVPTSIPTAIPTAIPTPVVSVTVPTIMPDKNATTEPTAETSETNDLVPTVTPTTVPSMMNTRINSTTMSHSPASTVVPTVSFTPTSIAMTGTPSVANNTSEIDIGGASSDNSTSNSTDTVDAQVNSNSSTSVPSTFLPTPIPTTVPTIFPTPVPTSFPTTMQPEDTLTPTVSSSMVPTKKPLDAADDNDGNNDNDNDGEEEEEDVQGTTTTATTKAYSSMYIIYPPQWSSRCPTNRQIENHEECSYAAYQVIHNNGSRRFFAKNTNNNYDDNDHNENNSTNDAMTTVHGYAGSWSSLPCGCSLYINDETNRFEYRWNRNGNNITDIDNNNDNVNNTNSSIPSSSWSSTSAPICNQHRTDVQLVCRTVAQSYQVLPFLYSYSAIFQPISESTTRTTKTTTSTVSIPTCPRGQVFYENIENDNENDGNNNSTTLLFDYAISTWEECQSAAKELGLMPWTGRQGAWSNLPCGCFEYIATPTESSSSSSFSSTTTSKSSSVISFPMLEYRFNHHTTICNEKYYLNYNHRHETTATTTTTTTGLRGSTDPKIKTTRTHDNMMRDDVRMICRRQTSNRQVQVQLPVREQNNLYEIMPQQSYDQCPFFSTSSLSLQEVSRNIGNDSNDPFGDVGTFYDVTTTAITTIEDCQKAAMSFQHFRANYNDVSTNDGSSSYNNDIPIWSGSWPNLPCGCIQYMEPQQEQQQEQQQNDQEQQRRYPQLHNPTDNEIYDKEDGAMNHFVPTLRWNIASTCTNENPYAQLICPSRPLGVTYYNDYDESAAVSSSSSHRNMYMYMMLPSETLDTCPNSISLQSSNECLIAAQSLNLLDGRNGNGVDDDGAQKNNDDQQRHVVTIGTWDSLPCGCISLSNENDNNTNPELRWNVGTTCASNSNSGMGNNVNYQSNLNVKNKNVNKITVNPIPSTTTMTANLICKKPVIPYNVRNYQLLPSMTYNTCPHELHVMSKEECSVAIHDIGLSMLLPVDGTIHDYQYHRHRDENYNRNNDENTDDDDNSLPCGCVVYDDDKRNGDKNDTPSYSNTKLASSSPSSYRWNYLSPSSYGTCSNKRSDTQLICQRMNSYDNKYQLLPSRIYTKCSDSNNYSDILPETSSSIRTIGEAIETEVECRLAARTFYGALYSLIGGISGYWADMPCGCSILYNNHNDSVEYRWNIANDDVCGTMINTLHNNNLKGQKNKIHSNKKQHNDKNIDDKNDDVPYSRLICRNFN